MRVLGGGGQLPGVQKVSLPSLQGNRRPESWLHAFSICRDFQGWGSTVLPMDRTPTPFYWGEEGWCTRVPCVWGKRVALRNLLTFLLRQGPPCFPCWLSRRAHSLADSTFHLLSAGTSTKITDAGYTSQLFFFFFLILKSGF